MVDRFHELKKPLLDDNSVGNSNGGKEMYDLESGGNNDQNQSKFMKDYFDEISWIKTQLTVLKKHMANMKKLHDSSFIAIAKNPEEDKELENLTDSTNALLMQVKGKLTKLEETNKHARTPDNPAEERIRRNLLEQATRSFMDFVKEYQEMQENYKLRVKDKVVRQINIVKPGGVDPETMEQYLQGKKQIFTDVIIGNQVSKALEEIQERHREMLKLEESLRELHQLFVDMSVLVESQGEQLNLIQHQVDQAVSYTEKGTDELKKANKYQIQARKKMCCILIFFIVVIGVILLVVMKPGSSSSGGKKH